MKTHIRHIRRWIRWHLCGRKAVRKYISEIDDVHEVARFYFNAKMVYGKYSYMTDVLEDACLSRMRELTTP